MTAQIIRLDVPHYMQDDLTDRQRELVLKWQQRITGAQIASYGLVSDEPFPMTFGKTDAVLEIAKAYAFDVIDAQTLEWNGETGEIT